MSTIIDELIYDRTNADLEVAREYIKNNEPLPNDNLRYAWDNRALNRTEEAMQYVDNIFKELGYFRNMEFKTDWFAEEITPEQSERYISNLKTLRGYLTMSSSTPDVPNTINGMSIEKANDIEKIIYDIDIVLEALQNNFIYCGVSNMGQDRIWQQRFRRKPYTRIEYIESTGTQYIDTEIKPNQNTGVDIDFDSTNCVNMTYPSPFGSRGDSGTNANAEQMFIGIQHPSQQGTRTWFMRYGTLSYTSTFGIKYGRNHCVIQNGKYTINNSSYTFNNQTFQSPFNMYLFGYNFKNNLGNGENGLFKGKIYSCKIYDNGILVRDFVPVLNNVGEPCLLDKVHNKFYYNKGTGDFIAST